MLGCLGLGHGYMRISVYECMGIWGYGFPPHEIVVGSKRAVGSAASRVYGGKGAWVYSVGVWVHECMSVYVWLYVRI